MHGNIMGLRIYLDLFSYTKDESHLLLSTATSIKCSVVHRYQMGKWSSSLFLTEGTSNNNLLPLPRPMHRRKPVHLTFGSLWWKTLGVSEISVIIWIVQYNTYWVSCAGSGQFILGTKKKTMEKDLGVKVCGEKISYLQLQTWGISKP